MSVQNPTIPTPVNTKGVDIAVYDLQSHLDTELTWLTNGMGRAYRMSKVRADQTTVFLPEVYLGGTEYKYFAATPDNDKQAQNIIVVGNRTYPDQQLGFYGWKSFPIAIIFSANLDTINSTLLQTDYYTEHLIEDVEEALIRDLLGKNYRLTIDSVTQEFDEVYAEFDVTQDRGIAHAPMTHFRFNCTLLLKETCAPTDIPDPPQTNLVCWLKADVGVNGAGTPSDGAKVSSWEDQSGNNNDWSQAVFNNQPTYKATAFNGMPAIEFTNPQYLSRLATVFATQEISVYIVFKKNANPSGGQVAQILNLSMASFMGASTQFAIIYDVINFAPFPANTFFLNMSTAGLDGTFNASDLNPNMLAMIKTTSGNERRRNSSSIGTGTGAQTMNADINHYMGSWFAAGRTFEGYISELLIYGEDNDATTRAAVETYLTARYSL